MINAGSVGMAYEDEPGAYWALLGPNVELRRSSFTPASLAETGYPRAWPSTSRAEATRQLEAETHLDVQRSAGPPLNEWSGDPRRMRRFVQPRGVGVCQVED